MSDFKISSNPIQAPEQKLPSMKVNSKEKLEKAAKDFESMFMDVVMKSMRETTSFGEESLTDSSQVKFFQSMLDTEYSKLSSNKNKTGLAEMIVKQMSKNLGLDEKNQGPKV